MATGMAVGADRDANDTNQNDQNTNRNTNRAAVDVSANAGQRGTAGHQASPQLDRQIVRWLAISNRGEIELSQFGKQNASSDKVKDFAQKMVDQHKEFLTKLQRHGGHGANQKQDHADNSKGNNTNPTATSATLKATGDDVNASAGRARTGNSTGIGANANATATADHRDANNTSTAQRQNTAQGHMNQPNLLSLKEQACKTAGQLTQDELRKKKGVEFDKAFAGTQVHLHIEMLATLKTVRDHVSPELQSVIEEGISTTQAHLEHAKKLCEELEGRGARGAAN